MISLADPSRWSEHLVQSTFQVQSTVFAGAARRAGPDSMLILYLSICVCLCVYLSETISRPLIGRNSETSRDVARPRTA